MLYLLLPKEGCKMLSPISLAGSPVPFVELSLARVAPVALEAPEALEAAEAEKGRSKWQEPFSGSTLLGIFPASRPVSLRLCLPLFLNCEQSLTQQFKGLIGLIISCARRSVTLTARLSAVPLTPTS